MVIFEKEYDGESLYDLSRDIGESFDPLYNLIIKEIPEDEQGFQKGTFKVTIRWEDK